MTPRRAKTPPLHVRLLRQPGRAALRRLFVNYPHRRYQQAVQGLDRERLADFLTANFERLLNVEGVRPHGAWRGRRLTGLAALIPSPWHSGVYNQRMGKIITFLNYEDLSTGPRLIDRLLADARRAGYQHLSARLDGHDHANLQIFARRGFYMTDCSVKMSLDLRQNPPRRGQSAGMKLVPFHPRHLPAMRDIAATSHEFNHFFNDPALPRERTRELFRQWVERCGRELARHIFVALVDGEVAGFCVFLENQMFSDSVGRNVGILDFICLDSRFQGRGLGSALLGGVLYRLRDTYDLIELRTDITNYPALNLYARFGFKIVCSDIYLHYHS